MAIILEQNFVYYAGSTTNHCTEVYNFFYTLDSDIYEKYFKGAMSKTTDKFYMQLKNSSSGNVFFQYVARGDYRMIQTEMDGISVTSGDADYLGMHADKAIVTDHGILLHGNKGLTNIISLTNNNEVCFACVTCEHQTSGTNYTTFSGWTSLTSNVVTHKMTQTLISVSTESDLLQDRQDVRNDAVMLSGMSALSPLVFANGDYTTDIMIAQFVETHNNNLRVIEMNGQQFLFDGLFALRV